MQGISQRGSRQILDRDVHRRKIHVVQNQFLLEGEAHGFAGIQDQIDLLSLDADEGRLGNIKLDDFPNNIPPVLRLEIDWIDGDW